MEFIDLTCPACGAQLKIAPNASQATCEYCGRRLLIKQDPLDPSESPKTETEKYKEKLEREKEERSMTLQNRADEERGRAVMAAVSAVGEAKHRISIEITRIIIAVIVAAVAYGAAFLLTKNDIVPEPYAGYVPYAWIPLLPLGLFLILKSRSVGRGILFGAGIGLLLFWIGAIS